jgi:hypothetical protein
VFRWDGSHLHVWAQIQIDCATVRVSSAATSPFATLASVTASVTNATLIGTRAVANATDRDTADGSIGVSGCTGIAKANIADRHARV